MGTVCDVSKIILFTLSVFVIIPQAAGYYCNHDLCNEEQYCCGDNLCCGYVYSPWYFWVGVVFMILVLSACGGLFRYCYDSNSYVILHSFKDDYYPTKGAVDEEKGLSNVVESDAPPAYSFTEYLDSPEDYNRFSSYEQTKNHSSSSKAVCH